jgi:hypothetical protein
MGAGECGLWYGCSEVLFMSGLLSNGVERGWCENGRGDDVHNEGFVSPVYLSQGKVHEL